MLERIKEFGYKFYQDDSREWKQPCRTRLGLPFIILEGTDGNKHDVPKNPDFKIIFASANGISMTAGEIYKEFYGLTEEDYCYFIHGYGLRSDKYIRATEKSIGLVRRAGTTDSMANGHACDLPQNAEKFMDFVNGSASIGKVGDEWLVEVYHWYVIDDFAVDKYYFDHKPTAHQMETALQIDKAKRLLDEKGEEFTCWECGREVFWLDVEEHGIEQKLNCLKERYCGC